MSLDYQDLGKPGGPQPPQPGSPAPSSPPGTQPPPPQVDLSQQQQAPAPTPQPQSTQVADGADAVQQSLPPQGGADLDEGIRILQESLRPHQPQIGKGPPSPYPDVNQLDPSKAPIAAQPSQNVARQVQDDPGFVGRSINRLFGWDVQEQMGRDELPYDTLGGRIGTGIIGGVGGAEVGSQIPGPPIVKGIGAAVGSAVGTAVGSIAPETMMDTLEMAGILEPGTRDRLGLSDEQMKTLLMGEASLDIWFQGGAAAARMTGRGFVNLVTGANATSKGLAETATREGIALMPVQVGEGSFARGYATIFGRLPVAAGPIKKGATQALNQISTMFEGIPARLGPLASNDEVAARIMRDARYTTEGIANHFDIESGRLFAQANMMKVSVMPIATRSVTDNLMKQIGAEQPKGLTGVMELTPGAKDLRAWLSKNTRMLTDINPQTEASGPNIANLPLKQMDTVIQNVDQKMAEWARKGDSKTVERYQQVRCALQNDMVAHALVPDAAKPGRFTSTPQSRALMDQFRAMDEDMTYTVNQVLSSTTAQRLGIKTSVTGRAATMAADMGTKGFDKLGEVLLRGDNPLVVAELQRLTNHDTMRQLSSSVFNKALNDSYVEVVKGGARRFDAEAFSKALGLNAPTSSKFAQTQALMQASGGLTMDHLQQIMEIARRAGDVDIPNVSSFLVRRVTMGGDISKALPGAMVLAGTTGLGAAGLGHAGALVAGVSMIGGTRLLSSMIANPLSARALSAVMDEEIKGTAKTAAWTKAVSYGVLNMVKDHLISPIEAGNLNYNLSVYAKTIEKDIKRNAP